MYSFSSFLSVTNFYSVRGLEMLSELAAVAGLAANASQFAQEAATLKTAIVKQMWNTTTGRFCDGICLDPEVQGHSGIYSDMSTLLLLRVLSFLGIL